MTVNMVPQLVSIEGEYYDDDDGSFLGYDPGEVAELLGIDYEDAYTLTDRPLTRADVAYLDVKYPEYMGVWPLLAKIGAVAVKGGIAIGKKIAGAVKKKKASQSKASVADVVAKAKAVVAEKKKQAQANYEAAKTKLAEKEKVEGQKNMITLGIPLAGLALLLLLKKK